VLDALLHVILVPLLLSVIVGLVCLAGIRLYFVVNVQYHSSFHFQPCVNRERIKGQSKLGAMVRITCNPIGWCCTV